MKINKLRKAVSIYKDIEKIDEQIIEIEKLAMLVANGDVKSSFKLFVENKKEDPEKPSLDDDGVSELKNIFYVLNRAKKKEDEEKIKCDLTDKTTLQILGVLLCDKQEKRNKLIEHLEHLGVSF